MLANLKLTNSKISYFSFLIAFLILLVILANLSSDNNLFYLMLFFATVYSLTILFFDFTTKHKLILMFLFSMKLFVISYYILNNDYIIFSDSFNYVENLNSVIKSGDFSFNNLQAIASTLHIGHYYYMLIPYLIFESTYAIVFFNLLISSISLLFFYEAFKTDFGHKIAFITILLASVSMNILLFGSAILKDPFVLLITALIIYGVKTKKIPIFFVVVLIVLLFTVRIYAAFALIVGIIAFWIHNKKSKTKKRKKFLTFISIAIVVFFLSRVSIVQVYLDMSISYVNQIYNIGILTNTLMALFKFFFAPLPWNSITSINIYSILGFDSLLFLLTSFSLPLFLLKYLNNKELRMKMSLYLWPILINAIVLGYTYGGDSARQRIGIFIFLILIVVIGLLYKNPKRIKNGI